MKRTFKFSKDSVTKLVQWVLQVADHLEDGKLYKCTLTNWYPDRSSDANRYAWKLIGELATVMGRDPEDVYRDHIGQCSGNYTLVPIRDDAVEQMKHIWSCKGMGWRAEVIGPSKLEGYTNLALFYGSSAFNSKEMWNLTENLICECKQHGIDTDTPEQVAKRIREWGE